jgi:hypothetical protein
MALTHDVVAARVASPETAAAATEDRFGAWLAGQVLLRAVLDLESPAHAVGAAAWLLETFSDSFWAAWLAPVPRRLLERAVVARTRAVLAGARRASKCGRFVGPRAEPGTVQALRGVLQRHRLA